jgi:hypothetical protein
MPTDIGPRREIVVGSRQGGVNAQSNAQSNAENKALNNAQNKPQNITKTNAQSNAQSNSQNNAQSKPQNNAQSKPQNNAQNNAQNKALNIAQNIAQNKSRNNAQSKTQSTALNNAENKALNIAKSIAQNNAQKINAQDKPPNNARNNSQIKPQSTAPNKSEKISNDTPSKSPKRSLTARVANKISKFPGVFNIFRKPDADKTLKTQTQPYQQEKPDQKALQTPVKTSDSALDIQTDTVDKLKNVLNKKLQTMKDLKSKDATDNHSEMQLQKYIDDLKSQIKTLKYDMNKMSVAPAQNQESKSFAIPKETNAIVNWVRANSPPISATTKPQADPEQIEKYMADFNKFASEWVDNSRKPPSKLQAFQESLENAMDVAEAALISGLREATTPDKIRLQYHSMLDHIEKSNERYMGFNKRFLFDGGFIKKIPYLLKHNNKQYQTKLNHLKLNYFDRFFSHLRSKLSQASSRISSQKDLDDKDILEKRVNLVYEKIDRADEKLNAAYNGKISVLDNIITPQFFAMYGLKGVRIFFMWISLYLASKIMQEQYITKVFANQEEAPSLLAFIGYFHAIEIGFMILFLIVLYLAIWLIGNDESVFNKALFSKLAIDYVASTLLFGLIGCCIASVVTKKKYFRYKTDGPRAIRSLEELLFYVGIIIAVIPFFLAV